MNKDTTQDTPTVSATADTSTTTESSKTTGTQSSKSADTAKIVSSSSQTLPVEPTLTTTAAKYSSQPIGDLNASMENEFIKVIKGATHVAERVMPTLGGQGSSALIESMMRPFHLIVDDGRKVAESIYLEDPYENLGASVMKEVALQSDKESQDGTTTAVTLAHGLVQNHLKQNLRGTRMKRKLETLLPQVLAAIDAQTKEITLDDVYQVALTSSGDKEIAQLFANVFKDIGKDGLIELENSHVPQTSYELTDGIKLRGVGYLGQYVQTEPGRGVYLNPKILISKDKIVSTEQIGKIAETLERAGIHELVIYCEEIDMGVASKIAQVHNSGGFKTAIMVAPSLWKDWLYEDFALLMGANPIDQKNGKTFKNLTLQDLGTCEKLVIMKDETRLYGGKDVSEHIAALKEAGKQDDQQLVRAAWLSTKCAVLKIGANSEIELSHKRAKVLDTAGACKLALEGGIVPGGGKTLVNVSYDIDDELVKDALTLPARTIYANAGYEPVHMEKGNDGMNVITGEEGDLFKMNIVDPAKVVKNSVTAAFSIAGTLLSTKAVLPIPKVLKDKAERAMQGMPSY